MDWIENQVVITVSKDTTNFHRADIILTIDGIEAEQTLLKEEEYISGSPQWKRFKSLLWFGYGEEGATAKLKIKRGIEDVCHNMNEDVEVEINVVDSIPKESSGKRLEIISKIERQ